MTAKFAVFLFLLVNLFGCGNRVFNIDPNFLQYVRDFEHFSGKKVEMSISFKKQISPVVGVCITYEDTADDDDSREIEVDPDFWLEATPEEKEELLFHEMGHCVLDRDHDEKMILDSQGWSIPASIMYPYVFGGQTYKKYREYYLHELADKNTPFK